MGCCARPRPRKQLHRIEADADEQIALVDDRLLDRGVREHAGKPRMVVGHDAFRFVGDHRRDAAALAQRANGGGVLGPRAPRPTRRSGLRARGEKRVEPRPVRPAMASAASNVEVGDRANSWSAAPRPTSPGQSMCTGPGGRAIASWSARIDAPAARRRRVRRAGPLRDRREQRRVIEPLMLERPRAAGAWLSVNTRSGARSRNAHATPFTTDAAPGPERRQTRARPAGDFGLRQRGDRAGGFGGGQHERQARAAGGVDQIEIAAAAGHAEQRAHARVAAAAVTMSRHRRHRAAIAT